MRRVLKRNRIPFALWHKVTRHLTLLQYLDAVKMARLRTLTTWFLHNKSINGAQGLTVTLAMRITVAAQASLLILNLDIDYFDNWVEVILYPGAFRVEHEERDNNGLVSNEARVLSGEAWLRGPVILSWEDVERDSYHTHPGHNVVVHEFAHKLDGLNGSTNGLPPLPRGMKQNDWAAALNASYEALRKHEEAGETTHINSYAATNPAEYFAVVSEYLFTAPEILKENCPAVHKQLILFYQQSRLR